ncbi:hypothetical protein AK830_g8086 [Neonectria ditissima]|uniref:Zn(2)-C6 fungal-type domain-containing protein n=1 Tax=Neonectria ditissima TaxID=78410 RepID=A0A0P7AL20_9HYPO|nr:hypothetical protein AK830_g8086 [Neonectria ditissima]
MGTSSPPSPSYGGSQFPMRRRVLQACTNCRARKTRCDASKPRCSLCMSQNVECEYKDSQQLRIEPNTKVLLDRIQLLEHRLLSSPAFKATQTGIPNILPLSQSHRPIRTSLPEIAIPPPVANVDETSRSDQAAVTDMPYPLSHTANANHVLNWPIVQQLFASVQMAETPLLLSQAGRDHHPSAATDIFFSPESATRSNWNDAPVDSWRLFKGQSLADFCDPMEYKTLISDFFSSVNVFFPLLSFGQVVGHLERVVETELHGGECRFLDFSPAQYCLLLLVLCLGAFVHRGGALVRLSSRNKQYPPLRPDHHSISHSLDKYLWRKVQLLLGHVSPDITLEAAQCTMLARSWIDPLQADACPEEFRRLYWVAFIYEGDFMSELCVTLPSGINRYEDLIPYPTQVTSTNKGSLYPTPSLENCTGSASPTHDNEELVAFQVSTNASIRRLLNRVHSMVYDSKDRFRMTRVEYVKWLLRVSEDFWAYHDTIYRNLPEFLLVSQPIPDQSRPESAQHSGFPSIKGLYNNPWNVLRLQGRYYAAQHIIHRPFIDYVLLNMDHIESHPDRVAILQKCGLCLEGCKGFFSVFNVEEANSLTCLFATGMADIEQTIVIGKKNLALFSVSIVEFQHHLNLLDALDSACRGSKET